MVAIVKTKINTACYISMGLLGVYISVYQSIISTITKNYSISNTVAGIIISLHFIGSFVAPIIFGEIGDRIGKKSIIIISLNLLIIGLLMVYLFDNILLLAIGIFIIGCGFAVNEGILSGLLSDVNIGKTNKVINISQMFLSIGAVTGPLITLLLIKLTGSWKFVFPLMIVLFGVILLYFTRLRFDGIRKTVQDHKNTGLISIKLFKEKIFIYLCISIFIYVGIEEGIAFWLVTYFDNSFNAIQLGTYALSAYWASMIVGRYLASRFNNKQRFLLNGGLIASLVFICIALLWQNGIVSLICFAGVGLGFSAVWPIIISITAENYPKYTGTAMGIMMTAGAGGGIAVPFLIGTLTNFGKIYIVFWVVPILIVFILVTQIFIEKSKPHQEHSLLASNP